MRVLTVFGTRPKAIKMAPVVKALSADDAFLIAVPTPLKAGHKPYLSYIETSAKSIAPVLTKGNLVILESTSPVGTTEQLAGWLAEERPDLSVNDSKPEWVIRKAEQAIAELFEKGITTEDVHIVCLGLTYKPDIDDLRESPALKIAKNLAERHAGSMAIVEPNLQALPMDLVGLQAVLMTLEQAIDWAHILILLVDHVEFKHIKPTLNNRQVLIDTRGIWKYAS